MFLEKPDMFHLRLYKCTATDDFHITTSKFRLSKSSLIIFSMASYLT